MKILIDHSCPFMLAHGGLQVQIEQTKKALEAIGCEVDWLRWWDAEQKGDVIHYFGLPGHSYHVFAERRRIPIVCTVLISEACNRSAFRLNIQAAVIRTIMAIPFGGNVKNQLYWKALRSNDCTIVGLNAEKMVLQKVFGVSEERVEILPLGCEDDFLTAAPSARTGDHLISVATITEGKRNVELAEMAIAAKVPILFVGKPYSETDPYYLKFLDLANGSPFVRFLPYVNDRQEMIRLLQNARGFVLYSQYENWCIVADEAIACGLPLLLPEKRWVQERFGSTVSTLGEGHFSKNVQALQRFFDECPAMAVHPKPLSWKDVAVKLLEVYKARVAATAR